MKSAEHWANETGDVTTKNGAMIYTCAEVKQIQLDAMREGMRMASAKLHTLVISGQRPQETWQAYYQRIVDTQDEAVLSAAEQLTEKDL